MRRALPGLSLLCFACGASPPTWHHLVVTAQAEPGHCFAGDAEEAIAAFGSDVDPELILEANANELMHVAQRAAEPTLFYYAGHGTVSWDGPVIGASQWNLERGSEPVRLADLLARMSAPWVSVIAAACESAWVDISQLSTPVSIVSASGSAFAEEPTGDECRGTSTFGRILADGLKGEADENDDCLVTDEEIARYVNGHTKELWPAKLRPTLRVTRNRPSQFPVARVRATPSCEDNWRFMMESAAGLGAFGSGLEEQVRLAQGESADLPTVVPPLYVLAGRQPELATAVEALPVLRRLTGDSARAARLAKLAIFSRIFELRLATGILNVRDLAGGEPTPYPAEGRLGEALADALAGCGRVELVTSDFFYVRFPDALPTGRIRAREATSSLAEGRLLPCSPSPDDVVGSCWRFPYDSKKLVYDGDPVICVESQGGRE